MVSTDEGNAEGADLLRAGSPDGSSPPPLRLAVGLGDPERERELLPALGESGEFLIGERCLSAEQLVACVQRGHIDAALVAADLHRLSGAVLAELGRARVPLVLLAPAAHAPTAPEFPAVVVPLGAAPDAVRQALLAAIRGELPPLSPSFAEPEAPVVEPAAAIEASTDALSVIALASGHGSPGRTTLAVSLAAALGAVAPTVLVDADLSGPSIAAYLDADPTRNLYMLAHAEPESPREWERAIAQETQPLDVRSPHGVVLCGVPKPEMRTGIAPRFFERLVRELRQRYRYVILDTGADVLGPEATVHRAALGLGQQVLLLAAADVVGLWHARTALGLMQTHLQVGADRVALIINRHDRRYHHSRMDIEWALGVPTAAVIPYDHGAAQRAITAQRPLVLDGRSRAARAVLDLADRLHGGNIVLPPEPTTDGRARWRRWLTAMPLPWPRRNGAVQHAEKGAPDGDYATPVT